MRACLGAALPGQRGDSHLSAGHQVGHSSDVVPCLFLHDFGKQVQTPVRLESPAPLGVQLRDGAPTSNI